jgi:hypothetical protein
MRKTVRWVRREIRCLVKINSSQHDTLFEETDRIAHVVFERRGGSDRAWSGACAIASEINQVGFETDYYAYQC